MIEKRKHIARPGNPYALEFDGSNYVRVFQTSDLSFLGNEFAVSIWFYAPNEDQGYIVWCAEGNEPTRRNQLFSFLWQSSPNINAMGVYVSINATPLVGKWNALAFTAKENDKLKVWLNGVFVGEDDTGSRPPADNMAIAARSNNSAFTSSAVRWEGKASDFRIYSRALEEREIKLQSKGVPISTKGLVGHWPFNEGSGTTAHDISGKGNDGTLEGNPTWTTDTPL